MNQPIKTWSPHQYQRTAGLFCFNRTHALGPTGGGALLLDPGMGKTAIVLEHILNMRLCGYIRCALVVAPRRAVQEVWPSEVKKWSNFHSLNVRVVDGDAASRKKKLTAPADIYVISRDNVSWLGRMLKANKHAAPWQLVVYDESHSFKTWSASRSEAARLISQRVPYRLILTGTPATNGLGDLFPQIWLLDHGQALGKNLTEFQKHYCYEDGPFSGSGTRVRQDLELEIRQRIEHMCLRLDIEDYIDMPDQIHNTVWVDLPPEARDLYDTMEEQLFIQLRDSCRDVGSVAALYGCCRQIANGGIYDNDKRPMHIHNEKVEAVIGLLEELGGKPALIPYLFRHDAERLQHAIKGIHVIRGGMKDSEFKTIVDRWNSDTLHPPYVAVQPQSMAEAVNLQYGSGRDIIWMGCPDSLNLFIQLNARIWRQGVDSAVRVHRILARNTLDEMVSSRIDAKFDVQENLLQALREYGKQKFNL